PAGAPGRPASLPRRSWRGTSRPARAAPGWPRRRAGTSAAAALSSGCSLAGPHLERGAGDDRADQRREPVVRGPRRAHDLAHRGAIVILDAAAEREREQLFGERADENLRPLQQSLLQTG